MNNKAYRKQVLLELEMLGAEDTCKVKQGMSTESYGYLSVKRTGCAVYFELNRNAGYWNSPYTPAQMASLSLFIIQRATMLSFALAKLTWIVGYNKGQKIRDSIVDCRVDFLLSRKVTCSFSSRVLMDEFATQGAASSSAQAFAELHRWAGWREKSVVAINRLAPTGTIETEQQLSELIHMGKQSLVMRMMTNSVGVLDEQSKYIQVPTLPGNDT